jgi:hypothetical protein
MSDSSSRFWPSEMYRWQAGATSNGVRGNSRHFAPSRHRMRTQHLLQRSLSRRDAAKAVQAHDSTDARKDGCSAPPWQS